MSTDISSSKNRIVIRADILGYCMGVRRAVKTAEKALRDFPGKTVFTLGPLIHNNQALEMLSAKGLNVLLEKDIETLCNTDSVVIVRTHGIEPAVMDRLEKTGCCIINATCPRVLSNQYRARKFSEQKYCIILAGDIGHGEVISIAGHAQGNCIIVKNEAAALSLSEYPQKAILISQTTISREEYERITGILKNKIPSLQVFDTICPATVERQQSLLTIAEKVQGILVIGGKHSSNTSRLFTAAKEKVPYTALIETADEIPEVFFTLDSVGITAGASTPDEIIDAVEQRLLS